MFLFIIHLSSASKARIRNKNKRITNNTVLFAMLKPTFEVLFIRNLISFYPRKDQKDRWIDILIILFFYIRI